MAEEQKVDMDVVDEGGSSEAESTLAAIMVRRQHVLERLNNRKEKQQAKTAAALLSKKQMDGSATSTKNNQWLLSEECHLFDKNFSLMAEKIHLRLKKLKEDNSNSAKTILPEPKHDEGDGSHLVKKDMVSILAEITVEIQELQKFLTSSTIFLPSYNIKSCQDIINELTINLENVRSVLLPKKRFGFSGRNTNALPSQNETIVSRNLTLVTRIKESFYQENTLSNKNNEYICLRGEEVDGKDITISQLEKCFVELQGHPGSVQISNAIQCTFLVGPTARSLFAENCKDCVLSVACQQLRFHSSSECKLYLHVTCRAIIEDCRSIVIAVYQNEYPGIEEDFVKAGLNRQHNNYTDVADFNWLSASVPSPNWCLAENHQLTNSIDWEKEKQSFLKSISSNPSKYN